MNVFRQVAEASMTVNSKEAYKMVIGMFNHTISDEVYVRPEEDREFEQQFALTTGAYSLYQLF